MASGTLYTYPGSFRANKIQIAAAYSGAKVTVDSTFEYGKTNTSAEFLKKFPLGKVPAFESNGTYLNESDAIAQYVSNECLLGGKDVTSQAAVREYISFSENEILPSACTWVYPTLGFKQYNKQDTEKAQEHIKKCLSKLNNDLLTKTFLVGERVTLADITLCSTLVMLYVQVLDDNFRKPYGNVNRWFVTCINQPNFKKVLGEVVLCKKMATFDNKRYQELHPKGGKQKKEQKPKEEKPKKAQEPKPQQAEAPAEAPKPKKIDYFADVPASSFVLDDWKKEWSNNKKDIEGRNKWFLDNYDKNAYSIWHCEYIMDDEIKKEMKMCFKASNNLNGFVQRIEGLRKHVMGILMVFEEDGYHSCSGIWIQRGQKLAFTLNEDWNVDAPYYDFKKLDLDNPEDKLLFFKSLDGYDAKDRESLDWKLFK